MDNSSIYMLFTNLTTYCRKKIGTTRFAVFSRCTKDRKVPSRHPVEDIAEYGVQIYWKQLLAFKFCTLKATMKEAPRIESNSFNLLKTIKQALVHFIPLHSLVATNCLITASTGRVGGVDVSKDDTAVLNFYAIHFCLLQIQSPRDGSQMEDHQEVLETYCCCCW